MFAKKVVSAFKIDMRTFGGLKYLHIFRVVSMYQWYAANLLFFDTLLKNI